MKTSILAVLALVLSQSAFAQYYHGHGGYGGRGYYGPRVGVYFGAPFPYFPPPTYYYPPSVIYAPPVTVREPVYIEQSEILAPPPPAPSAQNFESGYWYYCQERGAYYPSVTSCPGAWQKVAPSPKPNR